MKKTQAIWSTEALVDLETIYYFLAEKSEPAAQRITEDILHRVEQIETFPESGAIQLALKSVGRNYRYLVEGNYKIIYSYDPERQVSYIETVFDTRYNPEKLKV